MKGIGTIVNMALIIAGSGIGLLFGRMIKDRFKETIMHGISLVVMLIGLSGCLSATLVIENGKLGSQYTLLIILSLVIGAVVGEALNLDALLQRLGEKLQKLLLRHSKKEENRFAEGFFSASLLYCVGAMAIVGALNDGLLGDPTMLYTKGLLDGVSAIIFSASWGVGVLFSALSVGIYQGAITLLAFLIEPLLTEVVIEQMTGVGFLLILALSLNMLGMTKIRVGNLLPAILVPLVYYGLQLLFS